MSMNQGKFNDQPPKPKAKPYTNPDHMNVNNNGYTSPARNKPTKPAR